MNIEDLIVALSVSDIRLNAWDEKLVYSFYDQIARGSGFTEKQSTLAIKTLKRHSQELGTVMKRDLSQFLENPIFRFPIRKISNEKRLTVVDDPTYGRLIRAVFPYNENTVARIRENRDNSGYSVWDKDQKCWLFALTEGNINFLSGLDNFEVDDTFADLVEQMKEIHAGMENYIPMLVIEEKVPKLKNCSPNVPALTTTDLLESIFESRKRGINTWDETISNFLDSDEVTPLTRTFLKSEPSDFFGVDSEVYEISEISDIIKHLAPTLVVIPGGNEYESLKASLTFFKDLGISNKDMSVMFRLPTTEGDFFNYLVKEQQLNSPIDENTKVVFVSSKMPKPVLKSKIKFHSVLNMGFQSVHYTMKDFLKNHENMVSFTKNSNLRNTKIGLL